MATITYYNTIIVIDMDDKSYILDNNFTAIKDGELVIIKENSEHPELKLEWKYITGEVSATGLFNKLIAWKEVSTPNAKYALQTTTDATYTYIAEALPGTSITTAAWRVKRVVTATGVTTWADGNANFDNLANSLTTLTYA